MVNAEQPARKKPPLTRRVKFGIGATAFSLAFILSGLLIGFGIVAVILMAPRKRIGIFGAVVLNAAVCSLLLMAPLDYSAKADPEGFSLYVLLAIFALVPAAALVLLLSPRVFSSWALASRPFITAAVA